MRTYPHREKTSTSARGLPPRRHSRLICSIAALLHLDLYGLHQVNLYAGPWFASAVIREKQNGKGRSGVAETGKGAQGQGGEDFWQGTPARRPAAPAAAPLTARDPGVGCCLHNHYLLEQGLRQFYDEHQAPAPSSGQQLQHVKNQEQDRTSDPLLRMQRVLQLAAGTAAISRKPCPRAEGRDAFLDGEGAVERCVHVGTPGGPPRGPRMPGAKKPIQTQARAKPKANAKHNKGGNGTKGKGKGRRDEVAGVGVVQRRPAPAASRIKRQSVPLLPTVPSRMRTKRPSVPLLPTVPLIHIPEDEAKTFTPNAVPTQPPRRPATPPTSTPSTPTYVVPSFAAPYAVPHTPSAHCFYQLPGVMTHEEGASSPSGPELQHWHRAIVEQQRTLALKIVALEYSRAAGTKQVWDMVQARNRVAAAIQEAGAEVARIEQVCSEMRERLRVAVDRLLLRYQKEKTAQAVAELPAPASVTAPVQSEPRRADHVDAVEQPLLSRRPDVERRTSSLKNATKATPDQGSGKNKGVLCPHLFRAGGTNVCPHLHANGGCAFAHDAADLERWCGWSWKEKTICGSAGASRAAQKSISNARQECPRTPGLYNNCPDLHGSSAGQQYGSCCDLLFRFCLYFHAEVIPGLARRCEALDGNFAEELRQQLELQRAAADHDEPEPELLHDAVLPGVDPQVEEEQPDRTPGALVVGGGADPDTSGLAQEDLVAEVDAAWLADRLLSREQVELFLREQLPFTLGIWPPSRTDAAPAGAASETSLSPVWYESLGWDLMATWDAAARFVCEQKRRAAREVLAQNHINRGCC